MYDDALTIYSGHDGKVVFDETGLRSVFYAPYGISVLDSYGRLCLIDPDSGRKIDTKTIDASKNFAAFCGIIVDNDFLDGKILVGAAQTADGYVFAVSDGTTATFHDGNGKKMFEVPTTGRAEAFFTETAAVISPFGGIPAAYSLKNGRKIADLEKGAYLTYL